MEFAPSDPNYPFAYVTRNNRLMTYRVYDDSDNLLRTVRYTYYETGNASNITIQDHYVDSTATPGDPNDYDQLQDLALYYYRDGKLWRALWGEYELDPNGAPTGEAYFHGDLIDFTMLKTDSVGDAGLTEPVAYTAFGEDFGENWNPRGI